MASLEFCCFNAFAPPTFRIIELIRNLIQNATTVLLNVYKLLLTALFFRVNYCDNDSVKFVKTWLWSMPKNPQWRFRNGFNNNIPIRNHHYRYSYNNPILTFRKKKQHKEIKHQQHLEWYELAMIFEVRCFLVGIRLHLVLNSPFFFDTPYFQHNS